MDKFLTVYTRAIADRRILDWEEAGISREIADLSIAERLAVAPVLSSTADLYEQTAKSRRFDLRREHAMLDAEHQTLRGLYNDAREGKVSWKSYERDLKVYEMRRVFYAVRLSESERDDATAAALRRLADRASLPHALSTGL